MNLDKKRIVKMIEAFAEIMNLDPKELVVNYGAACVMHGFREQTNDIDIDVSSLLWDFIKRLNSKSNEQMGLFGPYLPFGPYMDLHKEDYDIENDTVIIHGIRVVNLPTLLKSYELLHAHPDRKPEKRANDLLMIRFLQSSIEQNRH